MKKDIKVVFIGDAGVGKSSIISSLGIGQFVENPQRVVPELTLSGDYCTTHIIDTCDSDEQHAGGRAQMQLELKRADAIALVYSYDKFTDGLLTLRNKWLPLLQQLNLQQPLVVVGNKADCVSQEEQDSTQQQVVDTLNHMVSMYRGSIRWVQCSAKTMANVQELMECTQNMLVFPEEPLYNRASNELTPECHSALHRIFRLCDLDCDDLLNDNEINYFQQRCLNQPMSPEEIEHLRTFIASQLDTGVRANAFTFDGFVLMNLLFLAKSTQQTWIALRAFNYDDTLQLADEFIHPSLNVRADEVVELSEDGVEFLHSLFKRYDSNSDGLLSDNDLSKLFATTPAIPFASDFKNSVQLGKDKQIGLSAFVCLFQMLTNSSYRTALEYFAYLGYNSILHSSTAHLVSIAKRSSPNKSVYNIFVVGASTCGKSTLLNSLLNQPFDDNTAAVSKGRKTICSVVDRKYITVTEIGDGNGLVQEPKSMDKCDAVCLMFDEYVSQSFEHVVELYKTISKSYSNIPVYFVRGHQSAGDSAAPPAEQASNFFSQQIKQEPIDFYINKSAEDYKNIIRTIMQGIQASLAKQVQSTVSNKKTNNTNSKSTTSKQQSESSSSSSIIVISLVAAAVAVAGFFVFRSLSTAKTAAETAASSK